MWSFLFVVEVRIKDIELVALDSFWGRIIVIIMHSIILVPFNSDSLSVDILRFQASEATLSLTGHPIIKLLLVLLHPLVFLELNDLFSDEVVGLSRLVDDVRAQ